MERELKIKMLSMIEKYGTNFSRKSNVQYLIRCPICGDSSKNPNDAHCYIKCDINNEEEPLFYNCFLCNCGGVVNTKFLQELGVKSIDKKVETIRYNRLNIIKVADVNIITGDPIMKSPQIRYIEHRLGKGLKEEDYRKFKIVWDMKQLFQYITSQKIRNTMPNNMNSVSFLSDSKSVLLTRSFDDDCRWRKISLFKFDARAYYTIGTSVDLFTEDKIVVNIAEGIFDILSVYKNFNDVENSVFIASLGSDYVNALEYAIMKGFVCSNVEVRIYIDDGIDMMGLKRRLKKYKWMFGNIFIYKNTKSKDVGVKLEDIKLIEKRV